MNIEFDIPGKTFEHHFQDVFLTEDVLTPGERSVLKGISVKRRMDFSTGRYCAREVLKKIGLPDAEILIGSKNEPLWPQGFVGSISHTKGLAGAVGARSSQLISIGLDIEKTGRVKEGMWDILFLPEEQEFLRSLTPEEQNFHTTLFFSMKESFYKLQYPLTKEFLAFTDVLLEKHASSFRISIPEAFSGKQLLPEYTAVHYTVYEDKLITVCFIEK
jgi:4'-phosphopantetheinyl transferase EntD